MIPCWVALALSACGGDDKRPAADSVSADTTVVADNRGFKSTPEDDPVGFASYINNLAFSETGAVEKEFDWGTNSAKIRIIPASESPQDDWRDAIEPANEADYRGYAVMKIINLTQTLIGPFQLGPKDTAYLFVGRVGLGAAARPGYTMYVKNMDGVYVDRRRFPWGGGWCESSHTGPSADLRARECYGDYPPDGVTGVLTDTTGGPGPGGQALWVTCRGGCCEVQVTN
jgi:hypothetical protein